MFKRVAPVVAAVCVLAGIPVSAAASAATIRLTGRVEFDVSDYPVGNTEHCAYKKILLIDVPSDVVSYTASIVQSGLSFGSPASETFTFSGPPFTNPVTGFGNPYQIPAGEAGWFMGGGSGPLPCTDGDTYTDFQATGTLETVKITAATISSAHDSAKFILKANGPTTGLQCALVKKSKKHNKPAFKACRSPKIYKHLSPGRYRFEVRVHSSGRNSAVASKSFTIG
jgi:hypothetical protein